MTWAATAIGAGTAIGGAAQASGGKKGSGQSAESRATSFEQANLARTQRLLAEQQAGITLPLRQGTANIFNQFLQTGQTPGFLDLPKTVSPLAALSLPALGDQQNLLRNQLMQQGSRGGLLQQQLAGLTLQGGLQRTGLMQQDVLRQEARDTQRTGIAQGLFGGASDFGTGGLSQTFGGLAQSSAGLGQAAQNLNQLGAQRLQQNAIAQQGVGQILGKGVSGLGSYLLPAPSAGSLGGSKLARPNSNLPAV